MSPVGTPLREAIVAAQGCCFPPCVVAACRATQPPGEDAAAIPSTAPKSRRPSPLCHDPCQPEKPTGLLPPWPPSSSPASLDAAAAPSPALPPPSPAFLPMLAAAASPPPKPPSAMAAAALSSKPEETAGFLPILPPPRRAHGQATNLPLLRPSPTPLLPISSRADVPLAAEPWAPPSSARRRSKPLLTKPPSADAAGEAAGRHPFFSTLHGSRPPTATFPHLPLQLIHRRSPRPYIRLSPRPYIRLSPHPCIRLSQRPFRCCASAVRAIARAHNRAADLSSRLNACC